MQIVHVSKRIPQVVLIVLLSWIFTPVNLSCAWKLEELQKRLKEEGATWRAGETSVSHLTKEELKLISGDPLQMGSKITFRQTESIKPMMSSTLPLSHDWRNYNGANWITSVKDQSVYNCASCTFFATISALETLIRFDQNDPYLEIDLSEQFLVSCGPSGQDYGGCNTNYLDYTANFLMQTGTPDEFCFPYDPYQSIGTELPCADACNDYSSRIYKLSEWNFLSSANVPVNLDYIKAELISRPVVCAMDFSEDFLYYVGGVYEPLSGQEKLGGHAVCIVGYDDIQSCWIVKNSFGTNWGENGYFRINYNQSAINSLTQFGKNAMALDYGSILNDADGDGVNDDFDNCPDVYNPYQLDFDDDGIGSKCDECSDRDGDGYGSMEDNDCPYDNCPDEYNPNQEDKDGDGKGDVCDSNPDCPMITIYGEYSEEVELLRYFRDNVLSKSQEGKELIKLYYQWSPLVLKTMREDEQFKKEVKELIDEIFPLIEVAEK